MLLEGSVEILEFNKGLMDGRKDCLIAGGDIEMDARGVIIFVPMASCDIKAFVFDCEFAKVELNEDWHEFPEGEFFTTFVDGIVDEDGNEIDANEEELDVKDTDALLLGT